MQHARHPRLQPTIVISSLELQGLGRVQRSEACCSGVVVLVVVIVVVDDVVVDVVVDDDDDDDDNDYDGDK